jgi:CRP/FNR family cyclic AMP-dependent transcriptional regulator
MASFDSAWFLYGALLLLLATSFVVRIDYARIGLAAAALVALPLTLFRASDPGYSLLVLAILAVNIGILARLWLRGAKVRFSPEDEELRRRHFPRLSAVAARRLIDQGHWISARRG